MKQLNALTKKKLVVGLLLAVGLLACAFTNPFPSSSVSANVATASTDIRYHGEQRELLATGIRINDAQTETLQTALTALSQGQGGSGLQPQSNYFYIQPADGDAGYFLYEQDGNSYLWQDGEEVALSEPLFDQLYQTLSPQEYTQADGLKWLLRMENGKRMLISRHLAQDVGDPRLWYEQNFFINQREQERYIYMDEQALVSLLAADANGLQQGLAVLCPQVLADDDRQILACCLFARFCVSAEEVTLNSCFAQLVQYDYRIANGILELTNDQSYAFPFDTPAGEWELPREEISLPDTYSFAEDEAQQLVTQLLAEALLPH